jgi:hypothetical protein
MHSLYPKHVNPEHARVTIGNHQCKQPYSASLLNISAMSYGALSENAILALNQGAKIGNFFHNTGEGGLSEFHLRPGGDIVWNIGTVSRSLAHLLSIFSNLYRIPTRGRLCRAWRRHWVLCLPAPRRHFQQGDVCSKRIATRGQDD